MILKTEHGKMLKWCGKTSSLPLLCQNKCKMVFHLTINHTFWNYKWLRVFTHYLLLKATPSCVNTEICGIYWSRFLISFCCLDNVVCALPDCSLRVIHNTTWGLLTWAICVTVQRDSCLILSWRYVSMLSPSFSFPYPSWTRLKIHHYTH